MGYSANGNGVMYDGIWSVEQARRAIEQGDRLYALSPGGSFSEVELTEDGIRARPDNGAGDTLDDLPACG